MCTHNHDLNNNKKNITIFHLQIIFFTTVKHCSKLHGHVFVITRATVLIFVFGFEHAYLLGNNRTMCNNFLSKSMFGTEK